MVGYITIVIYMPHYNYHFIISHHITFYYHLLIIITQPHHLQLDWCSCFGITTWLITHKIIFTIIFTILSWHLDLYIYSWLGLDMGLYDWLILNIQLVRAIIMHHIAFTILFLHMLVKMVGVYLFA
jgi:hypothetical protein